MSKKSSLGRGLEALLPASPAGTASANSPAGTALYNFDERSRLAGRVADIEVSKIKSNPYQPREHFGDVGLEELAASIRELGIIQPVTVRAAGRGNFELISGERRVRAAKLAGLTTIPAFVRDADTEAMLEMAIVENVQREELDPIELALGYQRLIDECGLKQEDVAAKVGKNRTTVSNFIRLLNLPPSVQASLRKGVISVGHARAILGLENADGQEALLKEIEAESLSVRQVEQRVQAFLKPARQPGGSNGSGAFEPSRRDRLELQAFADQLRAHYGTRIQIKQQNAEGAGRIEIQYYSADDLQRIVEQLLKS